MTTVNNLRHILFVDADPAARRTVEKLLRARLQDVRLSCALNGTQALELLRREPVDLLITDPALPLPDGVDLLQAAQQRFQVPVLVVTARDSPMTEALAFARGAVDYFEKPLIEGPFLRCIHALLNDGGPSRTRFEVASLGRLVRLINAEHRTCTLRVTAGQLQGALYFSFGNLVDASHAALGGLAAAQEILGWDEVSVILDAQVRARPRTIHAGVLDLLKLVGHRGPQPAASPVQARPDTPRAVWVPATSTARTPEPPTPARVAPVAVEKPAHTAVPMPASMPPPSALRPATPTPASAAPSRPLSNTKRERPASTAPVAARASARVAATPGEYADSDSYFDLVERARELLLVAEFEAAERLLHRALELQPGGRVAAQNLKVLARRRGAQAPDDLSPTSP